MGSLLERFQFGRSLYSVDPGIGPFTDNPGDETIVFRFRGKISLHSDNEGTSMPKTPDAATKHVLDQRQCSQSLPRLLGLALLISLGVMHTPCLAGDSAEADNAEIARAFEEDQSFRQPPTSDSRVIPKLDDERRLRITVFRNVASGKLRTATDFFRAGIILQHTSKVLDGDQLRSLGAENHLLGFFLFLESEKRGAPRGHAMMGAAYNYYLEACGVDSSIYGFVYENGRLDFRPGATDEQRDEIKCGFDPLPYMRE